MTEGAQNKNAAPEPPPNSEQFTGEITVASRIVDYLSSGLYESPGACLKELVNNSYDADASVVEIFVKPDADRIIVVDDGIGFTRDEFEAHFKRVSESHKRDDAGETRSGRPKIGRIGIGLIAANELCSQMEIFSTREGQTDLMRVEVDFAAMRGELEERRVKDDRTVIKKGDYSGWTEATDENTHFTHIFLKRVRGNAQRILSGARANAQTAGSTSLYGLDPKTIVNALGEDAPRSWSDFDEYSQSMLEVGLNVPVSYAPGWCASDIRRSLKIFEREVAALNFAVLYDGTDLRKPTVLGLNDHQHFVRKFEFEGKHISAEGYFFAQRTTIHPEDLNGVLIRTRNAAIGEYDRGWMGFRSSEAPLMQRWLSAEVWADDRLEDAMNIDRRSFRTTHPAYVELQQMFHQELSSVLSETRKRLHQHQSDAKRTDSAREEIQHIEQVAKGHRIPITRPVQRTVKAARAQDPDRSAVRRVLTKRGTAELYELVLDVAKEQLTPAMYRQFASALLERLLR